MGVGFKENEEKITLGMIVIGIACIVFLVIFLISYSIKQNNKSNQELITIDESIANNKDEFEAVSIEVGKNVTEVQEEANNTLNNALSMNIEEDKESTKDESKDKKNITEKNEEKKTISSVNNIKKEDKIANSNNLKEEEIQPVEQKENPKFILPVKGKIITEFSPDSLIYSNTLEEWTVHNGVDIKADKTSVVVAASTGVVSSIKTDPRYGLTVIIDHENGYQTLYANLLTAEYVVEGEKVSEGQTIGTVGNSANFEILDEDHLHFELLKDGDYVNPEDFITF